MKKINEANVYEIEKKINYVFKDKSLLIQAFTRTSFCNEKNLTVKVAYHSNEVLEFFGDGVLSLSIISFLLKECTERYEHGIRTELNEGDFSNIKSKLSDKQNLSKSMKALGLEKYLLMGEGDAKLGIQNEPSVMEDLFESIVGAIFIDSGMNIGAVISSVSSMLDMSVYTNRQKISQSAKNALQEWCADKKRRLPPPRYETLSEDGPDHKKTYMRACYVGDKLVGRGIGKNFKLADAAAAEDALKVLMAKEERNIQTKVDKTRPKEEKCEKSSPVENNKESSISQSPVTINKPVASNGKGAVSSASVLKKYASSNKKPSPVFKDLGERKTANKTEYAVECSFLDKATLGTGASRSEARENAARLMTEEISTGKKKQAPKGKPKSKAQSHESAVKNASAANPNEKKSQNSPVKSGKSPKVQANKSSAKTEPVKATSRYSPRKNQKK